MVLTLPATGSEMNSGAVISYGHGKYPVISELVFPRFSILDPTVTFTLPKVQVANGVIDAFVHTAEQYLTFPVDARPQDRFAEGILQTLIEIGETTVAEPKKLRGPCKPGLVCDPCAERGSRCGCAAGLGDPYDRT